jgi:hypothetical protein
MFDSDSRFTLFADDVDADTKADTFGLISARLSAATEAVRESLLIGGVIGIMTEEREHVRLQLEITAELLNSGLEVAALAVLRKGVDGL